MKSRKGLLGHRDIPLTEKMKMDDDVQAKIRDSQLYSEITFRLMVKTFWVTEKMKKDDDVQAEVRDSQLIFIHSEISSSLMVRTCWVTETEP